MCVVIISENNRGYNFADAVFYSRHLFESLFVFVWRLCPSIISSSSVFLQFFVNSCKVYYFIRYWDFHKKERLESNIITTIPTPIIRVSRTEEVFLNLVNQFSIFFYYLFRFIILFAGILFLPHLEFEVIRAGSHIKYGSEGKDNSYKVFHHLSGSDGSQAILGFYVYIFFNSPLTPPHLRRCRPLSLFLHTNFPCKLQ